MTAQFDWNQFQEIEQKPLQEPNQAFEWEKFGEDKKPVSEKSFIQEIPRHSARISSRIAETIGGIPGDIQDLIQSGVFSGLEKLIGTPVSEESREKVKKDRAPSSSELKEMSQNITSGYTSPQNETEKSIDEFAETAASLLGPMKFRKALGVSLGSQLSKEGLKFFGAREGPQEAGKLGTMFLLTMFNPGGAMKYASSQYDKANALSKGASISAKNFESNLINLQSDLKKGVTTAAKNVVLKPTEELISKIKNGKISIEELTAAKRDINTLMGDPALLKRERILLKKLGGQVDEAIKPYEKINPEFSKVYRPANEIYGTVMQGNKASNFIKKTLGSKNIFAATVGEAYLGHSELILPTLAGVAGAKGIAKTSDFLTRIAKSPHLRAYYTRAMQAAINEDVGALRLYEDKIKKELNK